MLEIISRKKYRLKPEEDKIEDNIIGLDSELNSFNELPLFDGNPRKAKLI